MISLNTHMHNLSELGQSIMSHLVSQTLVNLLEQLLPDSIQILNVVKLTHDSDGINRTVIVNENYSKENLAIIVIDHLESPRSNITMFSTSEGEKDLIKMLEENLDWNQELEFAVSI